MTDHIEEHLGRLLRVGRELVSVHQTEAVLDRILEEARDITGARYAALGVLDDSRMALERFITAGIDPAAQRTIGELPRGRGVLGVLITEPHPLRLADVSSHPQSYGFPVGHPPMRSFLGVPITILGEIWGNLYLAEKAGGTEFTQEDEDAVVVLSEWAATAIDNARMYEASEGRRDRLERAVRSLEAARDIADAISGTTELERILELVVKRGRALVSARTVLIMLREGDDLVVAASAGHAQGVRGQRVPIAGSTSGLVMERGQPERVSDVAHRMRIAPRALGIPDARCALLVPMLHRGTGVGVLAAFDHGPEQGEFSPDDEELLRTFAASAGSAVAVHQSVEADRLRSTIAAADAERSRWARELHDQTLQSLGAIRVGLASALERGDTAAKERAIRQTIEDVEFEIANLRAIISDLRPSLLDDLGLRPAIESLVDRRREAGLHISSQIDLPAPNGRASRLGPELETTVYRVVQEALTNVVKHAGASEVRVVVEQGDELVLIEVTDNGTGFATDAPPSTGFGLGGMRERVYLAGGSLEITSGDEGTQVRASCPVPRSAGARSASEA